MPQIAGTSGLGTERIANFLLLSNAQWDLKFTPTNVPPFDRVGYFYAFVLDATSPFQPRLLNKGGVYRPGTFILFPSNFGFVNVRYSLCVTWNKVGVPWTLFYS